MSQLFLGSTREKTMRRPNLLDVEDDFNPHLFVDDDDDYGDDNGDDEDDELLTTPDVGDLDLGDDGDDDVDFDFDDD